MCDKLRFLGVSTWLIWCPSYNTIIALCFMCFGIIWNSLQYNISYFLVHNLPYPTFNDYVTHSHHIKDLLLILSQLYRYMFQRKMSPCFLFLLPFPTFNVAWLRLIVFVNCLQHVLLHHIPHNDEKLSSFANHKAYYKKYVSIQHLIHRKMVSIVLWISNFAEYLKVNKGIFSEPLKSNAYLACNVI